MLGYVFDFLLMTMLLSENRLFRMLQPVRFREESCDNVLTSSFIHGDSECHVTIHQWRMVSDTRLPGLAFTSYFYLAELQREVAGTIVDVIHGFYPHPTYKFFAKTRLPHMLIFLVVSRRFKSTYTGPYNPITKEKL